MWTELKNISKHWKEKLIGKTFDIYSSIVELLLE